MQGRVSKAAMREAVKGRGKPLHVKAREEGVLEEGVEEKGGKKV